MGGFCGKVNVQRREGNYSWAMEAPVFTPPSEQQLMAIQMNLAKAAQWAGVES
jgi:hypothetical protein